MSARITSTIESRRCRRAVFLVRPACLVCSGCSTSSCRRCRSCLSEASFSSIWCVPFWNVCRHFFLSQSWIAQCRVDWFQFSDDGDVGTDMIRDQHWSPAYAWVLSLLACWFAVGTRTSCMGSSVVSFLFFKAEIRRFFSALISIAECPKTCLEPASKPLTWMFWPATCLHVVWIISMRIFK